MSGDRFGVIPERIGHESSECEMKAREWPNLAKEKRDLAAECLGDIIVLLRKARWAGDDDERERYQAEILDKAQVAIRHLEHVGAQTVPT